MDGEGDLAMGGVGLPVTAPAAPPVAVADASTIGMWMKMFEGMPNKQLRAELRARGGIVSGARPSLLEGMRSLLEGTFEPNWKGKYRPTAPPPIVTDGSLNLVSTGAVDGFTADGEIARAPDVGAAAGGAATGNGFAPFTDVEPGQDDDGSFPNDERGAEELEVSGAPVPAGATREADEAAIPPHFTARQVDGSPRRFLDNFCMYDTATGYTVAPVLGGPPPPNVVVFGTVVAPPAEPGALAYLSRTLLDAVTVYDLAEPVAPPVAPAYGTYAPAPPAIARPVPTRQAAYATATLRYAAVRLPMHVSGGVVVHALGSVTTDAKFHSEHHIWPVGYTSCTSFWSYVTPGGQVQYSCRILDGGAGPNFQIVAHDDRANPMEAPTADDACQLVLDRVVKQQSASGKRPREALSLSGAEFFGYGTPVVNAAIEGMPGALHCLAYVFRDQRAAGSAAVPPALPAKPSTAAPVAAPVAKRQRAEVTAQQLFDQRLLGAVQVALQEMPTDHISLKRVRMRAEEILRENLANQKARIKVMVEALVDGDQPPPFPLVPSASVAPVAPDPAVPPPAPPPPATVVVPPPPGPDPQDVLFSTTPRPFDPVKYRGAAFARVQAAQRAVDGAAPGPRLRVVLRGISTLQVQYSHGCPVLWLCTADDGWYCVSGFGLPVAPAHNYRLMFRGVQHRFETAVLSCRALIRQTQMFSIAMYSAVVRDVARQQALLSEQYRLRALGHAGRVVLPLPFHSTRIGTENILAEHSDTILAAAHTIDATALGMEGRVFLQSPFVTKLAEVAASRHQLMFSRDEAAVLLAEAAQGAARPPLPPVQPVLPGVEAGVAGDLVSIWVFCRVFGSQFNIPACSLDDFAAGVACTHGDTAVVTNERLNNTTTGRPVLGVYGSTQPCAMAKFEAAQHVAVSGTVSASNWQRVFAYHLRGFLGPKGLAQLAALQADGDVDDALPEFEDLPPLEDRRLEACASTLDAFLAASGASAVLMPALPEAVEDVDLGDDGPTVAPMKIDTVMQRLRAGFYRPCDGSAGSGTAAGARQGSGADGFKFDMRLVFEALSKPEPQPRLKTLWKRFSEAHTEAQLRVELVPAPAPTSMAFIVHALCSEDFVELPLEVKASTLRLLVDAAMDTDVGRTCLEACTEVSVRTAGVVAGLARDVSHHDMTIAGLEATLSEKKVTTKQRALTVARNAQVAAVAQADGLKVCSALLNIMSHYMGQDRNGSTYWRFRGAPCGRLFILQRTGGLVCYNTREAIAGLAAALVPSGRREGPLLVRLSRALDVLQADMPVPPPQANLPERLSAFGGALDGGDAEPVLDRFTSPGLDVVLAPCADVSAALLVSTTEDLGLVPAKKLAAVCYVCGGKAAAGFCEPCAKFRTEYYCERPLSAAQAIKAATVKSSLVDALVSALPVDFASDRTKGLLLALRELPTPAAFEALPQAPLPGFADVRPPPGVGAGRHPTLGPLAATVTHSIPGTLVSTRLATQALLLHLEAALHAEVSLWGSAASRASWRAWVSIAAVNCEPEVWRSAAERLVVTAAASGALSYAGAGGVTVNAVTMACEDVVEAQRKAALLAALGEAALQLEDVVYKRCDAHGVLADGWREGRAGWRKAVSYATTVAELGLLVHALHDDAVLWDFVDTHDEEVDQEEWFELAGEESPSFVPAVGDRVVYFSEGHAELVQTADDMLRKPRRGGARGGAGAPKVPDVGEIMSVEHPLKPRLLPTGLTRIANSRPRDFSAACVVQDVAYYGGAEPYCLVTLAVKAKHAGLSGEQAVVPPVTAAGGDPRLVPRLVTAPVVAVHPDTCVVCDEPGDDLLFCSEATCSTTMSRKFVKGRIPVSWTCPRHRCAACKADLLPPTPTPSTLSNTAAVCSRCCTAFCYKCFGGAAAAAKASVAQSSPVGDWAAWECPACFDPQAALGAVLQRAVDAAKAAPHADVFANPVDAAAYPGYGEVVAHPVSLSTLAKGLEATPPAYTSVAGFVGDLRRIQSNCEAYCSERFPSLVPMAQAVVAAAEAVLAEAAAEVEAVEAVLHGDKPSVPLVPVQVPARAAATDAPPPPAKAPKSRPKKATKKMTAAVAKEFRGDGAMVPVVERVAARFAAGLFLQWKGTVTSMGLSPTDAQAERAHAVLVQAATATVTATLTKVRVEEEVAKSAAAPPADDVFTLVLPLRSLAADCLVLEATYDAFLRRKWHVGEAFSAKFADTGTSTGVVLGAVPHTWVVDPTAPVQDVAAVGIPWEALEVRWDEGGSEGRVNLWEALPADE